MTKDVENSSPSFLSRWARRKADAQADVKVADAKPLISENTNPNIGLPFEAKMLEESQPERRLPMGDDESAIGDVGANPPLPAIESLTNESDFAPFMNKEVASDMRNQAMKKLFTDPHYNVMDGLDIYIDDYTKSDPIPLEMLRKMTQSKALFLFEEEEKAEAEAAAATATAAAEKSSADEIISEVTKPTTVASPLTVDGEVSEQLILKNLQPTTADVIDVSIKSA